MRSRSERGETKVLMVLDSSFPNDIRVRKEFAALIDAGYDVSLLCYRRIGEPLKETIDGCKVIRTLATLSTFQKGLIDLYNAVFFINPILQKALKGTPKN